VPFLRASILKHIIKKKLDPVFLKGSKKAQKFSNSLPNRALFDKTNVIFESAFDVM
jgi:hypothetical protein